MTKAELDDFQTGRGIPSCMLDTRSVDEATPQLLHEITLSGVEPPHNELTLRTPEVPMQRSSATAPQERSATATQTSSPTASIGMLLFVNKVENILDLCWSSIFH